MRSGVGRFTWTKKKEYYEAHSDNTKEKKKAYREANKDKIKEQKTAYREKQKLNTSSV